MALEVKTAKISKLPKLPKLPENCFEPVGKGGWPPISTWIRNAQEEHRILGEMLHFDDSDIFRPSRRVRSLIHRSQLFEGPCAKLWGGLEKHSSRIMGAQVHQNSRHNAYQLVSSSKIVPHHFILVCYDSEFCSYIFIWKSVAYTRSSVTSCKTEDILGGTYPPHWERRRWMDCTSSEVARLLQHQCRWRWWS